MLPVDKKDKKITADAAEAEVVSVLTDEAGFSLGSADSRTHIRNSMPGQNPLSLGQSVSYATQCFNGMRLPDQNQDLSESAPPASASAPRAGASAPPAGASSAPAAGSQTDAGTGAGNNQGERVTELAPVNVNNGNSSQPEGGGENASDGAEESPSSMSSSESGSADD